MDSPRCFSCRNRIKPHQGQVEQAGTGHLFHEDCWEAASTVPAEANDIASGVSSQEDYARRIREEGVDGILAPYLVRYTERPMVPAQRADETDEAAGSAATAPGSTSDPVRVEVPAQAVVEQEQVPV